MMKKVIVLAMVLILMAVSYTHLDVYKSQILEEAADSIQKIREGGQ